MLSNAYFLAKFRFDTAENEPAKICKFFEKCIRAHVRVRDARGDELPHGLREGRLEARALRRPERQVLFRKK